MARRDAPVVGQGSHLGQVPDGHDNRCIELRVGRMVETLWPGWQGQGRGTRLLATTKEGMSCNAWELSGVKLTIKAGLEHYRNQVVLVETDNKVT